MLQDTVERKPSACVLTKKVEPEDSEKHENMFLSGQFVPYLIRRYAPGNGAVHVQDADKRKRSVLSQPSPPFEHQNGETVSCFLPLAAFAPQHVHGGR